MGCRKWEGIGGTEYWFLKKGIASSLEAYDNVLMILKAATRIAAR